MAPPSGCRYRRRSPTAPLLLRGPVPNRPQPAPVRGPGGWGPPRPATGVIPGNAETLCLTFSASRPPTHRAALQNRHAVLVDALVHAGRAVLGPGAGGARGGPREPGAKRTRRACSALATRPRVIDGHVRDVTVRARTTGKAMRDHDHPHWERGAGSSHLPPARPARVCPGAARPAECVALSRVHVDTNHLGQ